ncbi:hypothetical protein AAFN90_07940 [Erwiniaceae bacterium CAU 1747]
MFLWITTYKILFIVGDKAGKTCEAVRYPPLMR